MIDFKLAKELRDEGFPIKTKLLDVAPEGRYDNWSVIEVPDMTQLPTLPELIEACGTGICKMEQGTYFNEWTWRVDGGKGLVEYSPLLIEAVAKLWLELNKK